ncbi:MAG TPA: family 16 glycoside hydrolase, partial [Planctomycetota bacterium]|nr:family 16 glycoside hydrolase [Planctomycetota bacterium]
EALTSEHEYVQAWAIQLLCEEKRPPEAAIARFAELARESPSSVVRLYLAGALQRLPEGQRWRIAEPLARRAEDAQDHNLPLMLWYGIEPLVAGTPRLALEVSRATPIAALSRFIVRRAVAEAGGREILARTLATERDPARRALVLEEMELGLADLRGIEMPAGWPEARAALAADPRSRERALWVAIAFGDRGVLADLRSIAADGTQGAKLRRRAIDALARAKDAGAVPLLQELLGDADVRGSALEALAGFDDPGTAQAILGRYATFDADQRRSALGTLASRAGWARELLQAVERGTVARADLGAFVLRSLSSLGDGEVDSMLRSIWGIVRESPADRAERIRTLKEELSDSALARADLRRGREVYDRACGQCHVLFDEGGSLGPDLTGSNRADLDYLLSNVVDPSAVVGKDYLATMVWLQDGQLVTGVKKAETESTITLQTETGTLVLDRGEIEETRLSELSAMPEGLLETLRGDEIRDLVAYVRGAQQVALPDRPAAPAIFDGRSLAGWSGDGVSWSVEEGEIVGRTGGLARNEFLKGSVELSDFRLTLEVKLAGERGNSGIQFRSRVLADGDVEGYQADIGPLWWGKLYEEHGRGLLWERSGEDHVRRGEWNTYAIEAVGHRIRTWINGHPCVDLEDPGGATSGILALQIHSGGPTEVRFRNFRLEIEPARGASSGSSRKERDDAR